MLRNMLYYLYAEVLLMNKKTGNPVLALLTMGMVFAGSAAAFGMSAGSYDVTVDSVGGPLTVSVTVSEDSIENIEIKEIHDTNGVGDFAAQLLSEEITEYQSVNVDGVTGATLTSIFMKNAVKEALKQAGAEEDAFSEKTEIPAQAQEDIEADVVVVGGGLAGMSAAMNASVNGMHVVLVERCSYLEGTALVSDQSIFQSQTEPYLSDWLNMDAAFSEQGINLGLIDYPGFGEKVFVTVPDKEEGTSICKYVIDKMAGIAVENGALFLTDTTATGLLTENGAVTGIIAQPKGQDSFSVHAKAVILATGGFPNNSDLVNEYLPYAVGARYIGIGGNKGDALAWAEEIGAQTVMLDADVSSFMAVNPNTGFPCSYNYEGNYYIDENGDLITADHSYNTGAMEVYKAIGNTKFYTIYPEQYVESQGMGEVFEGVVTSKTAVVCEGLDAVAAETGLANVKQTLLDEGCAEDDTYYVMRSISGIYGTYGGLSVDNEGRVQDENNEAIPGLYAAGEVIGSLQFQHSHYYDGGLGPAMCMGYVAGNTAAADIK